MPDKRTSLDDTALLQAYYRAWSERWIDTRHLHDVLARASNVLWVGSYFSLAEPWADASWTVADLDRDMLAAGRRILPNARTVQADIRSLPFRGAFDTIVVLGAVTAYLLDDESLARAAASLARSLADVEHARLLIDAYDAQSIHRTAYFEGESTWRAAEARWTRRAQVQRHENESGVFTAQLWATRETAQQCQSAHFHFWQRAFFGEPLARTMERHGLRLLSSESNTDQGRLYQMYSIGK